MKIKLSATIPYDEVRAERRGTLIVLCLFHEGKRVVEMEPASMQDGDSVSITGLKGTIEVRGVND